MSIDQMEKRIQPERLAELRNIAGSDRAAYVDLIRNDCDMMDRAQQRMVTQEEEPPAGWFVWWE